MQALAKMPNHSVLINSARGPLIDENALIDALQTGEIAAAGLDVLEKEPPEKDNLLLTMENVVVSHTWLRQQQGCAQRLAEERDTRLH